MNLNLDGARTCAIAQAQGRDELLTTFPCAIHVGGHVNVWVCGYCFRSIRGTSDLTHLTCAGCGMEIS